MKKRNQLLALLLTGVMSISTLLTGCGNTASKESSETTVASSESTTQNASSGGQASSETKPSQTTNPEDNTLTVAIYTYSSVTDYETNHFTQYLEEQLGINLDFYLLPATKDETNTKISLMATSGEDLPDVLITSSLTNEMILNYGTNGLFLPLNDYIYDASVMPNYNSMPEDALKLMNEASTQADGNIYSVGKYLPADWNIATNRSYINVAWLDKLNLKMPETTEELKDVLIAFRDKDPNGNGMKDEIPMYAQNSSGSHKNNVLVWLMNSFIFFNGNMANGSLALNEDGTEVIAPFAADEFREGLMYMKDLYDEGLISASAFTDDYTQLKATLNTEPNVVGFVTTAQFSDWSDYDNNPNFAEMQMIKPVAGPEGISYNAYTDYVPSQAAFIFSTTEKADLAVKFLDAFYNTDTNLVARYGKEGVDFTRDESVLSTLVSWRTEMGIIDSMKLGTINDVYAEPNNITWHDIQPGYRDNSIIMGAANVDSTVYEPSPGNDTMAYHYLNYRFNHPEHVLPALKYTEKETSTIQDAITSIPSYVMTSMSEFVTGTRDPETQWDTYLKELESMGLSTWLEIAQDAYERTLQ